MKTDEIIDRLSLEEKHYELQELKLPVVEGSLYNTLGLELFKLYEKYEVEKEDQRRMEAIAFVLQCFALSRDTDEKPGFLSKWFKRTS